MKATIRNKSNDNIDDYLIDGESLVMDYRGYDNGVYAFVKRRTSACDTSTYCSAGDTFIVIDDNVFENGVAFINRGEIKAMCYSDELPDDDDLFELIDCEISFNINLN